MKSALPPAPPVRKTSLQARLLPFLKWIPLINRTSLRADLGAGFTGAFIVLPQGVSFAMIAGLPAESGVNYESGAITPLSSIFSALFLTAILLLIAPLTAWLPLSAMGGVILLVAFKLIDVRHIREILKTSRSESLVLAATFFGTLLFEIEFAICTGVLLSLAIYLTRMSHPRIQSLVPDATGPRGSSHCGTRDQLH